MVVRKARVVIGPSCGNQCLLQMELLLEYEWSDDAWAASLVAAAEKRHVAAVSLLLSHRDYVGKPCVTTALEHAAGTGDVEMVMTLVTGVTDNAVARRQHLWQPMRSACCNGQVGFLFFSLLGTIPDLMASLFADLSGGGAEGPTAHGCPDQERASRRGRLLPSVHAASHGESV